MYKRESMTQEKKRKMLKSMGSGLCNGLLDDIRQNTREGETSCHRYTRWVQSMPELNAVSLVRLGEMVARSQSI